jgi:hypothetical protein
MGTVGLGSFFLSTAHDIGVWGINDDLCSAALALYFLYEYKYFKPGLTAQTDVMPC